MILIVPENPRRPNRREVIHRMDARAVGMLRVHFGARISFDPHRRKALALKLCYVVAGWNPEVFSAYAAQSPVARGFEVAL